MSVELLPFGVACNIQCRYCYQDPLREAGNVVNGRYDLEKMQAGLRREDYRFSIFGGEPLLMPLADLEILWRFGLETFGPKMRPGQWVNGVQTNGSLITPEHVRLFRQYQVSVGISCDGPGELNDARWAGSLERTREATARTEAAIRLLCQDGNVPSLHVILHRTNAGPDRLPRLLTWFRELDRMGIRWVTLHALEVDHAIVRDRLELDPEETIAAFLECAALEPTLSHLRFSLFRNIEWLLLGTDTEQGDQQADGVDCIWNACDPFTTGAVHGVDGQGESNNCARIYKDGVSWRKAEQPGFERQLALYHTPQEAGGCQGCRFFFACKGQCPGTATTGDWRNRSDNCALWMALFEHAEAKLLASGQEPLSLIGDRAALERELLADWTAGRQGSVKHALARARGCSSGPGGCSCQQEHGDRAHGDAHGDVPHGDAPHGDSGPRDLGSRARPLAVLPIGRPVS